jgi:hypothetical protein
MLNKVKWNLEEEPENSTENSEAIVPAEKKKIFCLLMWEVKSRDLRKY